MQQIYGIPGVPDSPDFVGGLNTQNVSGYSGFGRQATNPQFQNPTTWNPKVNYAINLGRHAVKTGFEFTTIRTEVMDINPVYGLNAYAGQFSRPSATSPWTIPGSSFNAEGTAACSGGAVTERRAAPPRT